MFRNLYVRHPSANKFGMFGSPALTNSVCSGGGLGTASPLSQWDNPLLDSRTLKVATLELFPNFQVQVVLHVRMGSYTYVLILSTAVVGHVIGVDCAGTAAWLTYSLSEKDALERGTGPFSESSQHRRKFVGAGHIYVL